MADDDNKITGKPTSKVAYLSGIQRDGTKLSVTWKVPANFADSNNKRRAEHIGVVWSFAASQDGKSWGQSRKYTDANVSASGTSSAIDLADVLQTIGRDYFYPATKTLMYTVKCVVHGYNSKGVGPDATVSRTFKVPVAPTLSLPEMDAETGTISVELTVPEDEDAEREVHDVRWALSAYDTMYKRVVTKDDSVIVWGNSDLPSETAGPDSGSTATDLTLTADVEDVSALEADKRSIKIAFRATTRGWRGDSTTAERIVFVAKPRVPTFGTVYYGNATNDRVSFGVKLNQTREFPTTGCRLQIMRNTPYTTEAQVNANLERFSWDNYDEQDDGQCTALSCYISEVRPDIGKYTWVRIHAWNLADVSGLTRESKPMRVTQLETPVFDDDKVYLDPLAEGGDGESVLAYAYWDVPGDTSAERAEALRHISTVFEWSTDGNAWYSTDEPESYSTTRRTAGPWDIDDDQVGIDHSYEYRTSLYIRGLEVAERVYVKARNYRDDSDSYSGYSNRRSFVVGKAPNGVTLTAPAQVRRGKPIPVSWGMDVVDELAEKVKWQLYGATTESKLGTSIASGTGGSGYTITKSKVESIVGKSGDQIVLTLVGGYGGATTQSPKCTVQIVDLPQCVVSVPATVTAQRPYVTVLCSEAADTLALTIVADGSTGEMPWGDDTQAEGDAVWTRSMTGTERNPIWDENAATATKAAYPWKVQVRCPAGLDLRDGARYTVIAQATDEGYSGPEATARFAVAWAVQAKAPSATVTPYDVTDADGFRTRGCTVRATPASGMSSYAWDLYRVTPDGAYLVAEDVKYADTIDDQYAPFGSGEHYYRAVAKTADGDLDWADFAYELPGRDMRIDWGSEYVELPYNVTMSDSWQKDFESRSHMDGSVEGYWNRAVTRSASLSTDLIRLRDRATETQLRKLANHSGPAFVRLPNGCAYQANVSVTIDEDPRGTAIAVSLDAAEVDLTDEFMASQPTDEADTQG